MLFIIYNDPNLEVPFSAIPSPNITEHLVMIQLGKFVVTCHKKVDTNRSYGMDMSPQQGASNKEDDY